MRAIKAAAVQVSPVLYGHEGTVESVGQKIHELGLSMAKRELGAFMGAVTELYGPEEARIAGEDWLYELDSTDEPLGFRSREWRQITIRAAARLASRLLASGQNATRVKETNAIV